MLLLKDECALCKRVASSSYLRRCSKCGKFYAIGNHYTHMGCLLSDGKLNDATVSCPCHFSVLDVKTGRVLKSPASKPEPNYEAKVDKAGIFVNL